MEPIARDRSLSTEPGSVGWIRDKAPPRGRDRVLIKLLTGADQAVDRF